MEYSDDLEIIRTSYTIRRIYVEQWFIFDELNSGKCEFLGNPLIKQNPSIWIFDISISCSIIAIRIRLLFFG